MIDFENEIFTKVSATTRAKYPKASIISEDIVRMPETFPAISIVEIDNYSDTTKMDSGSTDKYARVTYEVNVYSNLKTKRRSQCKEIISLIDESFVNMGFIRTSKTPTSIGGTELYRMVARYQALISNDGIIYRY